MRRRFVWIAVMLVAVGVNVLREPPSAVDFGRWRVVVLQSDDWGLEGWVPDADALGAVPFLADGLPDRLSPYLTSTLESASRVDSLAVFLGSRRDLDGLPLVLQANTVVAGVDLRPVGALGDSITIHPSGQGEGRYFRPGLKAAIDEAIATGVWWPELHGLTHYDLESLAEAWREGAEDTRRAAAAGVLWYPDLRGSHELGHGRDDRAWMTARTAHDLFVQRYQRAPRSVIAPDYKWDDADERAWHRLGIPVVQAKREQNDPGRSTSTWWVMSRKMDTVPRNSSMKLTGARFTATTRPSSSVISSE